MDASLAENRGISQYLEKDDFPGKLVECFINGQPLSQSEIEKLHNVLSKHILDCHKKFGKVFDFNELSLKNAEQGVATVSAARKMIEILKKH